LSNIYHAHSAEYLHNVTRYGYSTIFTVPANIHTVLSPSLYGTLYLQWNASIHISS